MSEAWNDAWHAIVVFVPKLLAFLLILVIGWFLAKMIGKAVDKVLERVGFDRAVERGGIKKALAKSQYDASTIVGKLVFYTLLLFVLQLAFGVFGPNPISELIAGVIAFLPKLLVAIVIVVITAAIAAAVRELISNTLGGLSYGRTLANIAAVFIIGIGVIAALNQVGIATTVTTPILIAVLSAIVGVIVVGVGGGLIKPMQARWESYLTKAEEEAPKIKEEAANAPSVTEQAREAEARYAHHEPVPAHGAPSAYAADPGYAPEAVSERPSQQYSAPQPQYTDSQSQSHDHDPYAAPAPTHDQGGNGQRDYEQREPSETRQYEHRDYSEPQPGQGGHEQRDDQGGYDQRPGDTQVFEQPSVDTQIFGDDPRGRSQY